MRRGPSGELEEAESRDTEVTLGPAVMIGVLVGLVVLCCVFFAFGYAVGHRSATEPASASVVRPTDAAASIQTSASTAKPTAAGQLPAHPAPAVDSVGDTAPPPPDAAPSEQGGVSTTDQSAAATQPQVRAALDSQVRPALSTQTSAPHSGQLAPEAKVGPALSQVPGWMVQVAAVSHAEDADVLVSALRKRGYPVTVRRELSDNLVHVRVGPFATRNEANAMQQKLLSDGYNALVQP